MSGFRRLVPLLAVVLALSACAGGPGPVVPDGGTTAGPACAPGAVEVGPTAEALQSAIDAARPGDALQLASTTYPGRFHVSTSGTAEAPIVLCGVRGSIIDGGDTGEGYALHLDGVAYWEVRDLSVRGAQKGVVLDAVSYTALSALTISDVGQEGLHLRTGSSDNTVSDVTVERTGLHDPQFGEGVYIGSAESNWCRYSDCQPDRSDRNVLERLRVSDTTAEAVDVKEGTSDGVIRSSTLSIARGAVVDSAVDLKGSGWSLTSSTVTAPAEAVSVHVILPPWGSGNTVSGSALITDGGGIGVHLVGAARAAGNVIACDNTVSTGASLGSSSCP